MSRMPPSSHARERMNKWFQPADGIAREVITADIQRYLGRDALVRPGAHDGVDGYWITAYRNLTSEMVQDLKQDSLRWRAEQQGHSTRGAPAYLDSQTHQSRQYYGPSVTPAPVDSPYGVPAASHAQRDPYAAASVRETAGYPSQAHAGYAPTAGYAQAPGSAYPGGQAQGYQQASYDSPASAYSNIRTAPTPSAYSSTSNYSASTQASSYNSASPGYPSQTQGGYVTSTTPQSYDAANQPRTVAGYEGYAPPGARTAADPYAAAGYRTGQVQVQAGYGYQTAPSSGRETVYQSGGQPVGSSTTQAYYDQYGQVATEQTSSKRVRGHESSSHSSHRRR